MPQPLEALVAGLPVEIQGRADRLVADALPLDLAGAEEMSFVAKKSQVAAATESKAGVLFVRPEDAAALLSNADRTVVVTADPKGHLVTALLRLRPVRRRSEAGISPRAYVHPNAVIGCRTNIHPGATVGSGTEIGDDCDIHPGVCIGPGCRIGSGVQLHPNVVIYHDVTIGDRVTIQAGAVIGADGFGYETADGRHIRIPHLGTVRIEDDVDLGANTCIDRAVIGETVIGQGTKIDNLVQIAHNCRLGRHNLIVAHVGFAGSVTTGDYVVCAGQVGVVDHVHLGTSAVFGAKAGVVRDMPGGQTYLGAPAMPAAETLRGVMAARKLPEMRTKLKQLEKQVAELEARVPGSQPRREAA